MDRFAVSHYGMQALRAFSAVQSSAKQSWSFQSSLPSPRAKKNRALRAREPFFVSLSELTPTNNYLAYVVFSVYDWGAALNLSKGMFDVKQISVAVSLDPKSQ